MRPGDHGADPWDGSEPERPIDIEALRADDEFIESLMSGVVQKPTGVRPRGTDVDAELHSMLSAWVLDVRPETLTAMEIAALPAPVAAPAGFVPHAESDAGSDTEPFLAVTPRRIGWNRGPAGYARRALVAASLVAVVSSGLALGAYQSEPGGTLWPMTKVLYAEHARSVQAAADVTIGLNRARTALQLGHTREAAEAIRAVRATLEQVAPAQGHDAFNQLQLELSDQLATVDPKAAATLNLPPATAAAGNRAAVVALPATTTPVPLTDRAAEAGSAPASTTAATAGSLLLSTDPVAPVVTVPDPVVPAPAPAPVLPPVVPDPVAPDPVVPPPAPATSVPGPASTPPDPTTAPPVQPTTDPPVATTNPPLPADTTGTRTTGTGITDTGSAVAPADTSGATANAAAEAYTADTTSNPPADGGSLTANLLATVTNAASETASNANAAAGG